MEVHAHTHTARKKWTHYFWEFIMLFLAVFCGFLAENQREHFVEHQREKQFMASMVSDLKSDSNNLAWMHTTFNYSIAHIDSLIPLLADPARMDSVAQQIYQQQIYLNLFFKWVYNDRTVNQLKNSGNFRLIRKQNVSDLISKYDGYIRNFVGSMQEEYIIPQWEKVNSDGNEIFKTSVWREYMKDIKGVWIYKRIDLPVRPYFINTDEARIQQFVNRLQQFAVAVEWFNSNTVIAMQKNQELASLIRKEYHIK